MSKFRKEGDPVFKDRFHMGDRLRLARLGSNLTSQEVANLLGIGWTSFLGRENGNEDVGSAFIRRFERALGIREGTLEQNSCSLSGVGQTAAVQRPLTPFRPQGGRESSLREIIASTVRRRILTGEYRHKIPTEKDLGREFGVTRPTVGEALQPLRREGIIEGRRKQGTYIVETAES